ncbi:MAG: hypothetical protein H6632_00680 [Anaerolineales bacterium]|nr:hypothetical protein [Anaerolineales bacterium]
MLEGLLWFDSDPNRNIVDKINQAAQHYRQKLAQMPTVCYVNIQDFDENCSEINGIMLKPKSNILRHHYLVGVEQNN